MNKLEIKIPKRKSKVPIKSPRFLKWLKKKQQKRKQQQQQKRQQQERKRFNDKKIAFAKIKQYAKWNIIKKRFKLHAGTTPPYTIKDWFFN